MTTNSDHRGVDLLIASLTPRMRDALLTAVGQPVKPVNYPACPGEFAPRTIATLEKRGLLERYWTGPNAGKYVITASGSEVADAILATEDANQ